MRWEHRGTQHANLQRAPMAIGQHPSDGARYRIAKTRQKHDGDVNEAKGYAVCLKLADDHGPAGGRREALSGGPASSPANEWHAANRLRYKRFHGGAMGCDTRWGDGVATGPGGWVACETAVWKRGQTPWGNEAPRRVLISLCRGIA